MLLNGYMAATQVSGITRKQIIRKQLSTNLRFSLTLASYDASLPHFSSLWKTESPSYVVELRTNPLLHSVGEGESLEYCYLIKVKYWWLKSRDQDTTLRLSFSTVLRKRAWNTRLHHAENQRYYSLFSLPEVKPTTLQKKNDPAYALAFATEHSLSESKEGAVRSPLHKPRASTVRFLSAWTHKHGQPNSTKIM